MLEQGGLFLNIGGITVYFMLMRMNLYIYIYIEKWMIQKREGTTGGGVI